MNVFAFHIALGLIIIFAFLLNVLMLSALHSIAKRKARGKMKHVVLSNLAVAGIVQVILGYCVQLLDSAISKYHMSFCRVSGFVITFCGLVSIAFMTILSFDIAVHICRPLKSILFEYHMSYVLVILGWLYGLLWSVAPFMGMGGYVDEAERSCSLKWVQDTLKGKMFLLSLFLSCYLLPVTIIVTCFACIHVNIKRRVVRNPAANSSTRNSIKLFNTARRGNLRLCFFMSFSFIFSWTPYAIATGYIVAAGYNTIPEELLLAAALTAKCSSILNPAVYFYFDRAARKYIAALLRKCVSRSTVTRRSETLTRFLNENKRRVDGEGSSRTKSISTLRSFSSRVVSASTML